MGILYKLGEFYDHPLFNLVGGVTLTLATITLLFRIFYWFAGITPIIIRLGMGLWKRKIAILGSIEFFTTHRDTLIDSKIFKSKNIIHIQLNNIDKAKEESIFLVDWESFSSHIEVVFACRRNQHIPVIIYAKPMSIPHEIMNDIANRSNTVVVNFRGRLLNDIITSLITTNNDR